VEELYQILDRQTILGGLFHPRKTAKNTPSHAVDFEIPVDGAMIGARFHYPKQGGRTVLFFHGNGETVPDYDAIAPFFRDIGLNLFVVDYRGYGFSTGQPSVANLMGDAETIHHFLQSNVQRPGLLPLLMGRSLGSGPATHLASKYPDAYAGLILESGFADVLPLLRVLRIEVPGHLESQVRELLSNDHKLKAIQLPVLLLHGGQDTLIGPENARANFAAVPHNRKKLEIVAGAGHNNLLSYSDQYFGELANFIDFLK